MGYVRRTKEQGEIGFDPLENDLRGDIIIHKTHDPYTVTKAVAAAANYCSTTLCFYFLL
jgi:hypothetical protein